MTVCCSFSQVVVRQSNTVGILALFVMLAGYAESAAQYAPGPLDTSNPPRAWITAGVGLGAGAGSGSNGSAGASLTVGGRETAWVGQAAAHGNWSTEARTAEETRPYTAATGLNVGRVWARLDIAVAGFVGPALGWERTRADVTHRSFGALLGSQFFVTPAYGFGLGLEAFAFVHPDYPQVGVRLTVQIGNAWIP